MFIARKWQKTEQCGTRSLDTHQLAIVLQSNYLGRETIILLKERIPRDRVFESFSAFTL
jgi:hypothetical protein